MTVKRNRINAALAGLVSLAATPVLAQATRNQATADAVAASLRANPAFAVSRVAIEVRDGRVLLSGVVPSEELKAEAIGRASQIGGVVQVEDRLAVGDPSILPAQYAQPIRVARRGLGHGHGLVADGGMIGGPAGGMIGGEMMAPADPSGPLPEGPAIPGATQSSSPGYPNYAWPSYAPYPNFSAVGYPTVYPWQAWPNIGPFYPYPEVPLDWRAVTLRWDDGLWWLDFRKHYTRPFFTPYPFGLFGY
ncbi:MAG: hypothetical protein KatS3mg108_2367 [Isosphaeraceae bacterium]|jgi:hypothetical protein|nr:MAG: hypothetical protein KatS3mg108_2367 [Isosphaeraceae bacterium]